MDLQAVIYEKRDHIAIITMNRPEARNSMNDQLHGDLSKVWKDVRGDKNIWAAVLTAAGSESFCSGRDVKELSAYQQRGQLVPRYDPSSPTFGELGHPYRYNIWKPIIAGINGFVVGGGLSVMLSTDLRVMNQDAWIGDLHVNIGQLGGPWRVAQAMPYAIACELVLLGNRISAQRAFEVGLVNKVVPYKDVLPEAIRLAERACEMGPLAVQRNKEVMQMFLRTNAAVEQLSDHYAAEMRLTEDGKEGPRAFREKRKPVWKGC